MATTIQVSEHVKKRLDKIKKRDGHSPHDSIQRYLLSKSGGG